MLDDYEDRIFLGHCLDVLKQLPDESFHAVVTDPPYGLGPKEPTVKQLVAFLKGANLDTGGDFMGADWEIPSVPIWREVYRVLKPGGHVLSFGGTRAWDLISLGLRAAGFEYRDTVADEYAALQWIHGEGMPKSHNVAKALSEVEAKEWEGYGTGLKPAWEPILVFRKPFKGTVAHNVLEHGTGVINIDATRVKHASPEDFAKHKETVDRIKEKGGSMQGSWKNSSDLSGASDVKEGGRWPSNLVMAHAPGCVDGRCVEGCSVRELDDQSGDRPSTLTGRADPSKAQPHPGKVMNPNSTFLGERTHHSDVYADSGGASRFFSRFNGVPFKYAAKPSKKETQLDGLIENDHPTKKPVELMKWLIRLVCFKGAKVLDPYCGSGSTLHAACEEEVLYTGIERDPHAVEIAQARMDIVSGREQDKQNERSAFDIAMGLDDE